MYRNIEDLLEHEFSRVIINRSFLTKLENYLRNFKYKSVGTDNSEFLGSNLIGVKKFVFSENDGKTFLKDLTFKDERQLENLYRDIDWINSDFKVSSNTIYLTTVLLMYKTYNSAISNSDKEKILKDLYLVFAYKAFGSAYNYFFRYQADESVSRLTYEELDRKYLLKRYGSWEGVFEHRSLDVLPKGIFEDRLRNLTPEGLTDIINGLYTRIKDIVKNLFVIYKEILDRNEKINSSSRLGTRGEEEDYELEFKEVTGGLASNIQAIKESMSSSGDFVDDNLIYLVCTVLPSVKKWKLEELIRRLTQVPYPTDPKLDYVEAVVSYSYSYLLTKGIQKDYNKRLYESLKLLKACWSAGNIKEERGRVAKAMTNELVYLVLQTTNRTQAPTIAIGLMLYLFCKSVKVN